MQAAFESQIQITSKLIHFRFNNIPAF